MEPTLLAQQSSAIISRTREIFEDTPEGETPRQILCNAFYGVTDALLNITQVNGHPVVDISRQPTRSERWKSKAGLFALTTIDWLSQANHNLYGTNKPGLIGGSMTGIASVMGVPMLHKIDFFNNPLHALVVDIPQQEGVFPCDDALNAAQSLCTSGVEGGSIGTCGEQRFQVNHVNGELQISLLNPAGGLQGVPAETTCSALGVSPQEVATQVPEVQTQTPLEPTVPVAPTSAGNNVTVIPDYAATPGIPDVTCVENPLIGTFDTAAVIAGFKAACGIDINTAMAQEFLDATGTAGRTELYGAADAQELANWAMQQWPRFMGGEHSQTVITEVAPITPSDVCNLTDPSPEETIRLDTSSPEKLQQELLGKCGLSLTPEQLDFIARALGLDIWVNDTSADVRLQFIQEMAEALGVPVLGTPVAFEGPVPTPELATPGAGGDQITPESEQDVKDGDGFWDLNIMEEWKKILPGIERAFSGLNLVALLSVLAVPIVGFLRWKRRRTAL